MHRRKADRRHDQRKKKASTARRKVVYDERKAQEDIDRLTEHNGLPFGIKTYQVTFDKGA